jgi:biotin transport system substrate-specific component
MFRLTNYPVLMYIRFISTNDKNLRGVFMETKNMMYIALFASIVGVLGLIPPVPLPFIPVPITMQTMGVMLAGAILGARLGFFSLLVFVLLIAVGVPLLSGGRGGLGALLGPSGGYILSWPIAAFLIGFLADRFRHRLKIWHVTIFNFIGGILFVYLCGISYLSFVTDLSFAKASLGSLAFLPGDVTKAVLAAILAVKVRRAKSINPTRDKKSSRIA